MAIFVKPTAYLHHLMRHYPSRACAARPRRRSAGGTSSAYPHRCPEASFVAGLEAMTRALQLVT